MTSIARQPQRLICTNTRERGFTLLEVMISILVLTIGLISMLAVFSLAMASTQTAQDDMIAKQEAAEAIESVFTARNTSQISWSRTERAEWRVHFRFSADWLARCRRVGRHCRRLAGS